MVFQFISNGLHQKYLNGRPIRDDGYKVRVNPYGEKKIYLGFDYFFCVFFCLFARQRKRKGFVIFFGILFTKHTQLTFPLLIKLILMRMLQ